MLAAFVIASAIPLVWPAIPPLVDLPGHMGRYRVAIGHEQSADLARYFDYDWQLIGNLGVDLLVIPFAKLFGLELAVKLIVLAIPPMTVAGMLWIAREAHGRVPPTAAFALPLANAYPFQFGFINFALSIALALLAFGLWLHLARTGRLRLRLILFVPIACVIWIAHVFGWGVLGLLAFGAELVRRRSTGEGWAPAVVKTGLACAPLGLPVVATLFGPISPRAWTGDWFNLAAKTQWLLSILRDRWQWFDIGSVAVIALLLIAAIRDPRLRLSPILGVPALICVAAFLLLPRVLFGSNYADMRLIPYAVAVALLAIAVRPGNRRIAQGLAIAAFAFFGIRTAATTASFALHDRAYASELGAIDAIPRGAAILALIGRPCKGAWTTPRFDHLPSLAIVRRDAFANDQWDVESAQLIRIRHDSARPYAADPSQLVYPRQCRGEGSDFDAAIARFDRAAFDHVWTIGFAPGRARADDLVAIWSNGRSTLYRVAQRGEEGR